jgi:hypothetical protein
LLRYVNACYALDAGELFGEQRESLRRGIANAEFAAFVPQQPELAEQQVHDRQRILIVGDLRREIPAHDTAYSGGERQQRAHHDLSAVDSITLGVKVWRATT